MASNGKADHIEKGMRDSDVLLNWISPEDLIQYKKKKTYLLLNQQYRSSKYLTSHGDIPLIKQTYSWVLNRRDDVMITRSLCKMLITPAVIFHFGLVDDDRCFSCQVTDCFENILFACAKYRTQRSFF